VAGAPLAAVYEDDQDTSAGAVEALRKLAVERQVAAVVGELFSPHVLQSRPLVEQAGVPFLTGGTNPRTTEQSGWIFRVGVSDALLTDLMARYLVDQLKVQRPAVLHDGTGIHNARAQALVRLLQERHGLRPTVPPGWKPGERQFGAQLEPLRNAPVDAIVALGETPEGPALLQRLRAVAPRVPVVVHRDFGTRRVLEEAGAAAEGVLIVTEYAPALGTDEQRAWAAAYEQRAGSEANVIAAQYYDAVLLLAAAAASGDPSRAGIKVGLERLRAFPGVMTEYTFDGMRNGVHRLHLGRVRGGRLVPEALLEERP
jgi:branched-chain amino acid transport system substrate-binding protein